MSELCRNEDKTEVSDELWKSICNILAVPESHSSLRKRVTKAFGDYNADLATNAAVTLSDVQRIFLKCAEASDCFLHAIGPLVAGFDDGASAMARRHLAAALGADSIALDDLAASATDIRDRCLSLIPKYTGRGGRAPKILRNIFVRRLAQILMEEQIPASDRAFSVALKTFMAAAGVTDPPGDSALASVVRRIRRGYRIHIN